MFQIKLNNLYFLIVVSIIFSYKNGLSQSCGNSITTYDIEIFSSFETIFKQRKTDNSLTDTIYLELQPHIARTSSGSGGISETDVYSVVEDLNNYYKDTHFRFHICSKIDYIDADSIYNLVQGDDRITNMANTFNNPNAVNVYFVYTLTNSGGSSFCGMASLPSSEAYWVTVTNSCANDASTLSHEIGHFFGLYHTHEDGFGVENATRNSQNSDYNCEVSGDLFCDTPADPKLSSSTVNSSCIYTGNEIDPTGMAYSPDPENIMSYTRSSCRESFSPMQIDKMEDIYSSYFTDLNYCYDISNVPADLALSKNDLTIFPNPATNAITIKNSLYNFNSEKLIIYDMLGNEIIKQKVSTHSATINTSSLSKGIYTLYFENKQFLIVIE